MNDSSENEGSQAIESEQNLDSTTQLESIQKDPNFANIQIEDIKAESPIQQDKEDSECSEDSEYSQEEIENQKHQSHRECLSCSDTPNQIVLLECGHALCLKCTLNLIIENQHDKAEIDFGVVLCKECLFPTKLDENAQNELYKLVLYYRGIQNEQRSDNETDLTRSLIESCEEATTLIKNENDQNTNYSNQNRERDQMDDHTTRAEKNLITRDDLSSDIRQNLPDFENDNKIIAQPESNINHENQDYYNIDSGSQKKSSRTRDRKKSAFKEKITRQKYLEDESSQNMIPDSVRMISESEIEPSRVFLGKFTSVPLKQKAQSSVTFQNSSGRLKGSLSENLIGNKQFFDFGGNQGIKLAGYSDEKQNELDNQNFIQDCSPKNQKKPNVWDSKSNFQKLHTFRNQNKMNFQDSENQDLENVDQSESDQVQNQIQHFRSSENDNCFKIEDSAGQVQNHNLEIDLQRRSSVGMKPEDNGERNSFNNTPMQSQARGRESNALKQRFSSEFEMRKSGVMENGNLFKKNFIENLEHKISDNLRESQKMENNSEVEIIFSKKRNHLSRSQKEVYQRSKDNSRDKSNQSQYSESNGSNFKLGNSKNLSSKYKKPENPPTISELSENYAKSSVNTSFSEISNEVHKILNPEKEKRPMQSDPEPIMCQKHKKLECIYWHVEKQKLLCADCLILETGTYSEKKQVMKELRTYWPVLRQEADYLCQDMESQIKLLGFKTQELEIRRNRLKKEKEKSGKLFHFELEDFFNKVRDLKTKNVEKMTEQMTKLEETTGQRVTEVQEKQKYLETLLQSVKILEKTGEKDLINFYIKNVREVNNTFKEAQHVRENIKKEEKKLNEEQNANEIKFLNGLIQFYEQIGDLIFEKRSYLTRKLKKLEPSKSEAITNSQIDPKNLNILDIKSLERVEENPESEFRPSKQQNFYYDDRIYSPNQSQAPNLFQYQNRERLENFSKQNQHFENTRDYDSQFAQNRNLNLRLSEIDKQSEIRFGGKAMNNAINHQRLGNSFTPRSIRNYGGTIEYSGKIDFHSGRFKLIDNNSQIRSERPHHDNINSRRVNRESLTNPNHQNIQFFENQRQRQENQMFIKKKHNNEDNYQSGNRNNFNMQKHETRENLDSKREEKIKANRTRGHRRCMSDSYGVSNLQSFRMAQSKANQNNYGYESQRQSPRQYREHYQQNKITQHPRKDKHPKLDIIDSGPLFISKKPNTNLSDLSSMVSLKKQDVYPGQLKSHDHSPNNKIETKFQQRRNFFKGKSDRRLENKRSPRSNFISKKSADKVISERQYGYKSMRIREKLKKEIEAKKLRELRNLEKKRENLSQDFKSGEQGPKTERIRRRPNKSKPKASQTKNKKKKYRNHSNKRFDKKRNRKMADIDLTKGFRTRGKNVTDHKKINLKDQLSSYQNSKKQKSIRSLTKKLLGKNFKTRPIKNKIDNQKKGTQIVYESKESFNFNDIVLSQNPSQLVKKDNPNAPYYENSRKTSEYEENNRNFRQMRSNQNEKVIYNVKTKHPRSSNQTRKGLKSLNNLDQNPSISESQRGQGQIREWIEVVSSQERNEKTRSGRARNFINNSQSRPKFNYNFHSERSSRHSRKEDKQTEESFHIYKDKERYHEQEKREIEKIKKNIELYSEQNSQFQNAKKIRKSQRSLNEGRSSSRPRDNI